MEDIRPSPEEMLARAREELARRDRGRLKIFFGAAPGVGKTYAMLEAAQARRREGLDVLIGWVETHGRAETEALAKGLARLPERKVQYREKQISEFDLDAALQRRPALLLVDELAHTNAPGARHTRRWQDVQELLEAGIDVYTTLNVQHVESLNDVIAQITGVTVRERVPDSVVDGADEIEFVDLPPDELLQRLREGKVYVPAQAERALENFFRKGNLIALRELALRRTAERVDAQVAQYKREHGIVDPWPTRERILVAVGPSPHSADLVRKAFRMATRLRAPWIALSVETPAFAHLPVQEQDHVAANLALAERLGAQTLVVRGERAADEILATAARHDVSRIIVGKPRHSRWRDRLRGSLVDDLVRGSAGIDVLVTLGEHEEAPAQQAPVRREAPPLAHYLWALGMVGVVTLACLATRSLFTMADQAMLYMLGILIVSSRASRRPSLVAAIASVAALDFFFVPPHFTFAVSDFRYVVTFIVMLAVGVTVSTLTVRTRAQAEAARQRERRTAALYDMSRDFSMKTRVDELAAVAVRHLRGLVETDATVLLATPEPGLRVAAAEGQQETLPESELAVARWVYENRRPAGHGTDTLPAARTLFLPLVGGSRVLGVVGLGMDRRRDPLAPSQRQLVETFLSQTAVALERALLAEEAERARLIIETERTRSDLLATVSHDLRTPLATITGAASVLLDETTPLAPPQRRELLATVRDEGDRLGRLVSDLLELTRVQSGAVRVAKEWYPLEEVIASALGRMRQRLAGRTVHVDRPDEVLLAPIDPVLLEQVFINLLENADKYAPTGAPIEVRAQADAEAVTVEVADRGPGIPEGSEERIFEKFYRAADGQRAVGTGLGLAVCRAVVTAHGGTIWAENRPGGGASFRFTLPLGGLEPPAAPEGPLPEEPSR